LTSSAILCQQPLAFGRLLEPVSTSLPRQEGRSSKGRRAMASTSLSPSFSFSLLAPTASVSHYPRPLPIPPASPNRPTTSAHAPRPPPPLSTPPLEGEMEHSHDGVGVEGDATATTALVPTSAIDSNGEPIVCNGQFSPTVRRRRGGGAQLITFAALFFATACKLGLEETLDNTVVSFGKYLFQ